MCDNGLAIKEAIAQAVATGEGQTCWMKAVGTNEDGVQVSEFNFEWTLLVKKPRK